jgi:hypothetical protein
MSACARRPSGCCSAPAVPAEQPRPLVGVQLARVRAAPEASGDEGPVAACQLRRDERAPPAPEDENPRVDGGRRLEGAPRQPPHDGRRVPGSPNDVVERARPRQGALHRNAPLHDHVSPREWHERVVEQVPQDGCRPVERKVRHHTEGLARERNGGRIPAHDLHPIPAPPQMLCPARIELDREDTCPRTRELGRQPAAARTEVEDEIPRDHAGVADKLCRECPGTKEMLATCAARPARTSCARLGHGPSP